jgi:PAS domain S-box-containing protein
MQFTQPTGVERFFDKGDIIVSKTDLKGHITYANKVFLDIASLSEREVIGAPHSLIRHPDMPRCIFKLFWDTLAEGREIFAYEVNMAKNGDHYWVFAHVTPTFDADGKITGYHSNRRVPEKHVMPVITELYGKLLAEENRHSDRKQGMAASEAMLKDMLKSKGVGYDEFIFSL